MGNEVFYQYRIAESDDHVTTEYKRCDIQNPKYKGRIAFWDTVGIMNDSIESDEAKLKDVMKGLYSDRGFMLDDDPSDPKIEEIKSENKRTRGFRVPQVIVVIMSFGMANNPETLKVVQGHISEVQRMGYTPIILLSKLDKRYKNRSEAEEIRKNPFTLPPNMKEEVQEEKRRLAKELKVGVGDVFHLVSYVEEGKRNPGIDKLNLCILKQICDRANQYMKDNGEEDYTENDNVNGKTAKRDNDTRRNNNLVSKSRDAPSKQGSSFLSNQSNPQSPQKLVTNSSQERPKNQYKVCASCVDKTSTIGGAILNCGHYLCHKHKDDFTDKECPGCSKVIISITPI